jgi:hypothetical protein
MREIYPFVFVEYFLYLAENLKEGICYVLFTQLFNYFAIQLFRYLYLCRKFKQEFFLC